MNQNSFGAAASIPSRFAHLLNRLAAGMFLLGACTAASAGPLPTFTIENTVFPATAVGQSTTQNVTLTVNSSVPITSIAIAANFKEYTLGAITGCTVDATGNTVTPLLSICTIPVTFKPSMPGRATSAMPIGRTAPLIVTDIENGKAAGYSFALSGTGTGPSLAFAPGYVTEFVGNPKQDGGGNVTGCPAQTDNLGDGCPAIDAQPYISSMALDPAGNLYIADGPAYVIHKVDAITGIISVIAGKIHTQTQIPGFGNGGPASGAEFYNPGGPISVDRQGNVYLFDFGYNWIQKIDAATGIISIYAGGGNFAPGTGHTALQTQFPILSAALFDTAGDLYLAAYGNPGGAAVYRIDAVTQLVTVVAGSGVNSFPGTGDGNLAVNATLSDPVGLAIDSSGNLYISDFSNDVVRRVDAVTQIITTYAGKQPSTNNQSANRDCTSGAGDGGAATSAFVYAPTGLAFDAADNLYIAQTASGSTCPIRRVDASTGLIHTVAGNPVGSFDDLDNIDAFDTYLPPNVLAVDGQGSIFFGMQYVGSAVRKIVGGTSGVVYPEESEDLVYGPKTVLATNVGVATTLDFSNTPLSIVPNPSPFFETLIAGTDPEDCSVGSLAPGATCGIAISFEPTAPGPFTATELLTDNSLNVAGTDHTIYISGSAYNGQTTTLMPDPLSFAAQATSTSTSQNLTYSDLFASSTFVSTTITGPGAAAFSLPAGSNCTGSIPAGVSNGFCSFPVAFDPAAAISYAATLTVKTLDEHNVLQTLTVPLTGSGLAPPAPVAVLTPSQLTFPGTPTGSTSAALTAQLANTGTATLNISSIKLKGTNPTDFTISANTCGATLAMGDNCSISVTFTPATANAFAATLSVADNAAGSPQSIPLSGGGFIPPVFTIANNLFDIPVGQTQTKNVTLTVNSPVPITSIATLAGFPEYTLGTITGCTIDATGNTVEPAGTICTIPVTFKPVAPGRSTAAAPVARSAPLLVTDVENAKPQGYTFPLEGTATGPLASFYPGTASVVAPGASTGCPQKTDQEGDGCPASDTALDLTETAVDSAGNIFVLEQGAYDVRRIDAKTGIVTTIAGQWRQQESEGTGDGGSATAAGFYVPRAIAVDSQDNVYIGDYLLLRKIDAATGIITSIAGDGNLAASKGGPAAKTGIPTPVTAITVDPVGTVFFSTDDGTVYRIDGTTGLISFVVGDETGPTFPATGVPGPASSAQIANPLSLALDSGGNLYIADQQSSAIYQVKASTGTISVYAGTPLPRNTQNNGCSSDTGDGGPATDAFLSAPFLIAFDPGDNLYVADGESGACPIRRVDASTGNIHTVAGNNTGGPRIYSAADTSATDLDLNEIESLSVDPFGNLLIGNGGTLYKVASGTASIFFPTEDGQFSAPVTDETNFVTLTNVGVTTSLAFDNEPFPTSGPPFTTYALAGTTPQDCSTAGALAPGASCGIGVSFDPTANGPFSGTVTVGDNSLNVPTATQEVSLLGTVIGYDRVTFNPTTLNFPSEAVGTPTTLDFTVTDTNTVTTNPQPASFYSGDTTSFSTGTVVCSPLSGGGSTCTVPVTFTPQATGPLSASLLIQIDDNTGGYRGTISLSGTGLTPTASVAKLSPATLVFPDTTVGQTAAAMSATLSNTGNAALNNIAVTIAGANPSDFATTSASTCGTTLAAGDTCTIYVTFTPGSATGFSATLTVTDSDTSSPQTAALSGNGLAVPVETVTGPFDLVFSPSPVPNGIPQTLTATFQITNYPALLAPTVTTHYGNSYVLGALTCTGSVGAQTCSIPVTFTPDFPGGRKDALFLTNGGVRLATVLLYGVGDGPFALVQPGSVFNPINSTGGGNNSYFYQSVTDENGTVWSIGDNVNTLTSVTRAGVITIIPVAGLSGPTAIAIDGAGVLYIAYGGNKSNFITYDTVQGTQGLYNVPGASDLGTVAIGNTGNIYAIDTNNDILYTIAPGGAPVATTLVNGSTNHADTPIGATVDSAENLFFGGYWTTNEYSSTGVQSTINTASSKYGIAVDAADTVYAGIYGAGIEELPASNYAASLYTFNDTTFPFGVSVGPDGTVNVGDYFSVNQYIRTQGALTFSTDYFGTRTAPPQTAGIYNGGNETLNLANIALTGTAFTMAPTGTTPCTVGLALAPGEACQVSVTFTSPHPGSFAGSLIFTSNTLNGTNATTTVALAGTMEGDYGVPSPAALNFNPQIVTTTSAPLPVTVTNEGYGQSMSLSLPNNIPDFTVSAGTCTGSIAVGASCQLSVTFTPAAVQPYSSTVTVGTSIGGGASGPSFTFTVAGTGISAAAPVVTLTPNPVAFANQAVAITSAPQPVTLANTGNATLNISGITLTGANKSDFAISANTCGATLAAGTNCIISVTFTPAAATSYAASLSVADNVTGSPQIVPLSGSGIAPRAVLAPTTISFPNTAVGSTAAAISTQLSNPGNAPLSISGITLAGTNPSDFNITANTCGTTLAAGANCSISVTFTPAAASSYSASISVADNVTGSPQTVSLSGSGTAPQAVLAPTTLSFPNTAVGSTATAISTQLSNPGNAPLNISGITLTGTNPSDFNITANTCGTTLAVGANCSISVTFTPAAALSYSASISVTDNAAGSPQTVSISGSSTAPKAVLAPTSIAFPNTGVGSTATAISTQLSNPGNAPLSISGITLTGTNPSDFTISSNTCGATLAAGANCSISITFTPAAATSYAASLSVADNVTGSPQIVPLSGSGIAPRAVLAPTTISFPNTAVGSTATAISTQLSNPGNAPLSISGITLTGTTPSDFTISSNTCGTTLAAGANCSISITFTPAAATSYSASLSVADNVTGSPQIVPLSGSGIAPRADLAPTTISFPNTAVGSTAAAISTQLSNPGNAPLSISGITLAGTNPSDFNITANTCGTTLAAAANCSISVTFTPVAAASYSASVSVTDNITGSPQTVSLSGSGTAPQAVLAPTTLSFPNTAVGSTATAISTQLSNPGNAPLNISGITLTGTNPSDFTISSNTCGTTLAAGANCSISVTFTPAAATSYSASLSVGDNVVGSPQSIPLSGTGTAPQATLAPTSIGFPNTGAGSTSAPLSTTLSNPGNATLNISGFTIAGLNPADFSISSTTCGTTLAPGANCSISVSFSPLAAGSYIASLSVADNATGSPQSVPLSGTGTAPQATLAPTSLSFPTTFTGSTSAALSTTLSNPGNATLNISGITITGANPTDFTLSANTCGSTLAVGATCSLSVTFTPASASAFSASLSVADNAIDTPQIVPLTGNGTPPLATDFTITPATPSNQAQPGSSASFTIDAAGIGGAYNSPIAFTAFGLPPGATYLFAPPSATPGSAGASTVLTIKTQSLFAMLSPRPHSRPPWLAALLLIPLAGAARLRRIRGTRLLTIVLLALALVPVMAISGCAGGYYQPGPETYTITVTGTSGQIQHSTTVTLTVE